GLPYALFVKSEIVPTLKDHASGERMLLGRSGRCNRAAPSVGLPGRERPARSPRRTTDLRSCPGRIDRQKTSAVTARPRRFPSVAWARPRAFSPTLSCVFLLSPLPFSRPSPRFFSCEPVRLVSLVWLSSLLPSCASLPCSLSIR